MTIMFHVPQLRSNEDINMSFGNLQEVFQKMAHQLSVVFQLLIQTNDELLLQQQNLEQAVQATPSHQQRLVQSYIKSNIPSARLIATNKAIKHCIPITESFHLLWGSCLEVRLLANNTVGQQQEEKHVSCLLLAYIRRKSHLQVTALHEMKLLYIMTVQHFTCSCALPQFMLKILISSILGTKSVMAFQIYHLPVSKE